MTRRACFTPAAETLRLPRMQSDAPICPPVPGLPPASISFRSPQDTVFTDHKCNHYEAISVRIRARRDNRRAWFSHQPLSDSPAALKLTHEESSSQEGKQALSFPTRAACPGLQDQERAIGRDLGDENPLCVGRGRGWVLTSVSAGLPLDMVLTEEEVGQKGGCVGANETVTLSGHLSCAVSKQCAYISSHDHLRR